MIALVALLATACGASPEGGSDDTPTTETPTTVVRTTPSLEPVEDGIQPIDPGTEEPEPGAPLPQLPEPKVSRAVEGFVAMAIADLANRLDIPESDITVRVAELVVWPDGALGCPQPGMAYTQVLVDGSRAVLEAGDKEYHYHGGGNRPDPFLCEKPG